MIFIANVYHSLPSVTKIMTMTSRKLYFTLVCGDLTVFLYMFQVINVNAIDISLTQYGAPRFYSCIAMVTRYSWLVIHFKGFLE